MNGPTWSDVRRAAVAGGWTVFDDDADQLLMALALGERTTTMHVRFGQSVTGRYVTRQRLSPFRGSSDQPVMQPPASARWLTANEIIPTLGCGPAAYAVECDHIETTEVEPQ